MAKFTYADILADSQTANQSVSKMPVFLFNKTPQLSELTQTFQTKIQNYVTTVNPVSLYLREKMGRCISQEVSQTTNYYAEGRVISFKEVND